MLIQVFFQDVFIQVVLQEVFIQLCLAGWLCSHCCVLQVGPTLTVVFGSMGFVLQLCLVRQVYYTIVLCWVCSPGCVLQDGSVHT